jgi:hypothetical protein
MSYYIDIHEYEGMYTAQLRDTAYYNGSDGSALVLCTATGVSALAALMHLKSRCSDDLHAMNTETLLQKLDRWNGQE